MSQQRLVSVALWLLCFCCSPMSCGHFAQPLAIWHCACRGGDRPDLHLFLFFWSSTSTHWWNFFYYRISISCLRSGPALFDKYMFLQVPSFSLHIESPGPRGTYQGLSDAWLHSPCWTSRAQQENTLALETQKAFAIHFWTTIGILSCCSHAVLNKRNWQRRLQIFLGYALKSRDQAALTLELPHKLEDFNHTSLLSTA